MYKATGVLFLAVFFLHFLNDISKAEYSRKDDERKTGVLEPSQNSSKKIFSRNPYEMNLEGEAKYLEKIEEWLNTLHPLQRSKAIAILQEARPALQSLRRAIFEKRLELAALNFNSSTKPEILSILGQKLQNLREKLREKLEQVNLLLLNEAGIKMAPIGKEGFWLQPLPQSAKMPEILPHH